ncbi:MAG: TlpA family protein disulfide reductase, partial [Candidatus Colwellbacteria bacterium]|nr:TlpA family protein disulfide reductase [Candidatus Colwellbacteria bacterium]
FVTTQNAEGPDSIPTTTDATEGNAASDLDRLSGLRLADYSGAPVSLGDYRGKPLVVNSWAAWCPFCKQELPDFAAAQKEFGERVTIIAVDRAESLSVAREYTDEAGITSSLTFLLDPSDSFYKAIGGFSMPETIFVDTSGKIVEHVRGPITLDEMREKITSLIGE